MKRLMSSHLNPRARVSDFRSLRQTLGSLESLVFIAYHIAAILKCSASEQRNTLFFGLTYF